MAKENCGVLVFCESTDTGMPEAASLEALGFGKKLSQSMDRELSAIAVTDISRKVAGYHADRIYIAKNPPGNGYLPEWYTALLEQTCLQCSPKAVILAHTPLGQDVAPRLAVRLGTWFVSDAVNIVFQDNRIFVQKPVHGGIALGTYSLNAFPVIITVRRGVGGVPDLIEPHSAAEIHEIEVPSEHAQWELVDRVKEETGIRLEDANIIVSGGRGIGGAEGFELLKDLAKELGAALGASRPPCDAGWIGSSQQVGITGAIVSPGLYIAIGISGTSQHLSGMADSGKIVAINNDPDAAIFKVSDYGVVCDYRQVLPAFIDTFREDNQNNE
jgi:electron transfer flavoprotein alpha subunit